MSDFRQSIKDLRLHGFRVLSAKRNISNFEFSNMIKLEEKLEKKAGDSLTSMPSPISLTKLLQKLCSSEQLSSSEVKNIPFVLFDKKCTQNIFLNAIRLLDMGRRSTIKRLIISYLMQYDDDNFKTDVIARIIMDLSLHKPFQTKDKFLSSCMEKSKILFGKDRMPYIGALISKTKNIDDVLKILSFPPMLNDCKFIISGLRQYYESNAYSLDDQYKLFDSLKNKPNPQGYLPLFPMIADVLIPRIEQLNGNKKNEYKKNAISTFGKLLGDPRFGAKSIRWNSVSEKSRNIFLHWIAERDLDIFFKIIEETAVDDMWSYRKSFWENYLPHISKTWVYFGEKAMQYARRMYNDMSRFGRLGTGCTSNQSVFVFQIDKYVFVEWSHNGKLRVWPEEDAPSVFYRNELKKSTITDAFHFPLESWVHSGKNTYSWQGRVGAWIERNCRL